MKTKNVKVKLKDVRAGVTAYVSHPIYGIRRIQFRGVPYMEKRIGLFVPTREENQYAENGFYEGTSSLDDMGITSQYNDRRTFFKLKHAEAWADKWKNDPGFIKRHARHEQLCEDMYDMGWPEDDYYGYDEE